MRLADKCLAAAKKRISKHSHSAEREPLGGRFPCPCVLNPPWSISVKAERSPALTENERAACSQALIWVVPPSHSAPYRTEGDEWLFYLKGERIWQTIRKW